MEAGAATNAAGSGMVGPPSLVSYFMLSSLLLDVALLALGGVFLYFGAEWLIRGASGLAAGFGVRPLVIGLTVVAYGTSMPELVVSSIAAVEGKGAIALGNVIGSNVANIGLILGITALIAPPRVEGGLMRRELPVLFLTTASLPVLLFDGMISRGEGALLLAGAILYTVILFRGAAGAGAQTSDGAKPQSRGWQSLIAIGGLVCLVAGGKVLVTGATGLARTAGLSERIIGLTIVAIGTSLPELATSLLAATRGHSSIAVGNVVGSNIFNVLFILGAAALIQPIAVPFPSVRTDILVLAVATTAVVVFLRSARSLTRLEGALMAGGYACFLAVLPIL